MPAVKIRGRIQMKNKIILRSVDDHLKEMAREDPEFGKLYKITEQKLAIVKPIIRHRINHNLTQGQFAKKIGVTQQHISKIENGEFSSMETLEKVLRYAGFTIKLEAVPVRKEAAHDHHDHYVAQ